MRLIFLLIVFFLKIVSVFAQKENNVWTFGRKAGLDFNTGQLPIPIETQSGTDGGLIEGFASVAHRQTGALLFYTDSRNVFDHQHNVMPNGYGLFGNATDPVTNTPISASTAQGALIVPFIGDTNKYYVFTLGPAFGEGKLYYSVVDMSLNNGLGDVSVSEKNILLDGSGTLSESMIAVAGNGCEVWVLIHESQSATFKAFKVTENGIQLTPVLSSFPNSSISLYQISYAAVAPDRTKVALTVYNNGSPYSIPYSRGLLLYRFDATSGILSDELLIVQNTPPYINRNCHGVAFSPDNTKLYIGEFELLPGQPYYFSLGNNRIVQFDVSSYSTANITASKTLLHAYVGYSRLTVLRRNQDKIYFNREAFINKIGVVNNPNLQGIAADINPDALTLLQGTYSTSLNNDVIYPVPVNKLKSDTLMCTRNGWEDFVLQAESGHIAYHWDNGDTANSRIIHAPGTYWVRYKTICNWHTDTFIVRHTDINFHLPADTVTCTGYLRFEVNVPDGQYLWQNGSTANQYTATQSGIYWLRVSKQGCAFTDTAKLLIPDVAQNLGSDVIYCNTNGIFLKLSAKVSDGATVQWSTGSTEPEITVHDKGRYWVSVTEAPCTGTDTIVVVEELCACTAFVPTAFSPNGDGLNDMFKPETESGCPVRAYNMQIFNRWGQLIFQNKVGYGLSGWDGTYKGLPADIGVYYYQLHFEAGTHHKTFVQKGEVTLVR